MRGRNHFHTQANAEGSTATDGSLGNWGSTGLIVACEAGFWIVLVVALATRHSSCSENLSRALLLSLPVIDILLLTFTALDLKTGQGNCRQPAPGAQTQQRVRPHCGLKLSF
jgi:hypothetical protein